MVPPSSTRIPRVRAYSGYRSRLHGFGYKTLTSSGRSSHTVPLPFRLRNAVQTPKAFLTSVWPLPLSLAATRGISFDFSSSAYLDVSVQRVPRVYLCIQYTLARHVPCGVSPFGHPRIKAYLQLPAAFRSLSRPSSASGAKAFTLCSL